MIGRVWPCHVVKMVAGTGRVRVFLITSPEMLGKVSVAFSMQALLSAARPLWVARNITAAAMAIFSAFGLPTFREKAGPPMSAPPPKNRNVAQIAALRICARSNMRLFDYFVGYNE
jgi:hypothetical protein